MDFIKWSARYGKNRFYKILLFFILFCIFTFFVNSCKVHATAITGKQVNIYTQTQNCDLDSSNNLACSKGLSFVFPYTSGSTNVSDIDMPYFLPNEHNILVSNLIYDVDLGEEYTISSSTRSLYLLLGNDPSFKSNLSLGPSNYRFTPNMFPDYDNANDRIPSTYGFKAFYCSYFDTETQTTKTCNVKYGLESNSNVFKVIPLFDIGTKLNRFTIYFGTPNLYNGSTKDLCGVRVPNSETFINSQCSSSNLAYKYYVLYDTWRQANYSSVGIFYYKKGAQLQVPKFKLPNYSSFLNYDSTDYSNYTYGGTFTNLSEDLKNQYNNLVNSIQQDMNQSYSDTWFADSMEGFTDSEESNSFINLFNSLISYPLQKFNEQNSESLTWVNANGTEIISDHICRGSGIAGDFGNGIELSWGGASFRFPCVHYDVYAKMYNENFSFFPTRLNGATVTGGNNKNFYSIYKIVLDGVLVYFMFVACLDIYKYILDSDRKEIEILDL